MRLAEGRTGTYVWRSRGAALFAQGRACREWIFLHLRVAAEFFEGEADGGDDPDCGGGRVCHPLFCPGEPAGGGLALAIARVRADRRIHGCVGKGGACWGRGRVRVHTLPVWIGHTTLLLLEDRVRGDLLAVCS